MIDLEHMSDLESEHAAVMNDHLKRESQMKYKQLKKDQEELEYQ
jgi:hypothetical protein